MGTPERKPARELITFADASASGLDGSLRRAHRDGRLVRVRRGVYRPAAAQEAGTKAERAAARYRDQVLAVACNRRDPVFTGPSALVLLGLPIIGPWPKDVFVMSGTAHGRRSTGVVEVARRTIVPTSTAQGEEITDVNFSLIQTARRMPLLATLVAADAACRIHRFADTPPLTTPEALHAEHERMLPYHGSQRMRPVLDRVTIGAESPLETLSGLLIEQLGFAAPRRQVAIEVPSGVVYVDFYWEEADIVGEADGDIKYRSAGTGAGAARRVIDENGERMSCASRCAAWPGGDGETAGGGCGRRVAPNGWSRARIASSESCSAPASPGPVAGDGCCRFARTGLRRSNGLRCARKGVPTP
ncbi:type IV toxin-antitoxin system AbiEi family antitoxin domain-containing protein [Ruania alba]|nr:type IV toxin-antitoxin system AbiEi family antitoxin domain-containing protein [Ruania alba]